MYENMTWNEVSLMLRKQAEELGHAPKMEEVRNAKELLYALPHGNWRFVLGYAGINPFFDQTKANNELHQCAFLEDMSDAGIIKVLKRRAFATHCTPREQDIYAYIECIYRWGSWPATVAASGMKLYESYVPHDPVPGTVDGFYKSYVKRCRTPKKHYR